MIKISDNTVTDPKHKANSLNTHFLTIVQRKTVSDTITSKTEGAMMFLAKAIPNLFSNINLTATKPDEIKNIIIYLIYQILTSLNIKMEYIIQVSSYSIESLNLI